MATNLAPGTGSQLRELTWKHIVHNLTQAAS